MVKPTPGGPADYINVWKETPGRKDRAVAKRKQENQGPPCGNCKHGRNLHNPGKRFGSGKGCAGAYNPELPPSKQPTPCRCKTWIPRRSREETQYKRREEQQQRPDQRPVTTG